MNSFKIQVDVCWLVSLLRSPNWSKHSTFKRTIYDKTLCVPLGQVILKWGQVKTMMCFHYYDYLFPWYYALSDTKKKLQKYYEHSSLKGLQVTECYLPIHLIKEVKICRYFVFWTLKKVNGPNVTAKIACKQQKIRVRHLQYIWAVFWGDAIFLLFSVCLAVLDILCNWSFSYHVNFFSFMFMHKISSRVVCVNGKHPKLVQQQQQQQQQQSKACFKRRATTVLSWLDCSSTAARH